MKKYEDRGLIFFGECAPYLEGDQTQRSEAEEYLRLWNIMLIRRLRDELSNHELVDFSFTERPALYSGPFTNQAYLSLKLCFQKKLPYELK